MIIKSSGYTILSAFSSLAQWSVVSQNIYRLQRPARVMESCNTRAIVATLLYHM